MICQTISYRIYRRILHLGLLGALVCPPTFARDVRPGFISKCIQYLTGTYQTRPATNEPTTTVPGLENYLISELDLLELGHEIRVRLNGEEFKGVVTNFDFKGFEIFSEGEQLRFNFDPALTLSPIEINGNKVPFPIEPSMHINEIDRKTHNIKNYVKFSKWADELWQNIKNHLLTEFESYSQMSRREKKAYLKNLSKKVDDTFKSHFGDVNPGLHYNMHGGTGYQYVEAGGINATYGDSSIYAALSMSKVPVDPQTFQHRTVFYYPYKSLSLSQFVLGHPVTHSSSRWNGSFLVIFDVDKVKNEPHVSAYGGYSGRAFSFTQNGDNSFLGVKTRDILLPPLQINTDIEARLRMSRPLTKDEVRIAVLHHLNELLSSPRIKDFQFR